MGFLVPFLKVRNGGKFDILDNVKAPTFFFLGF
jgi:hypothetical protein